MIINLSDETKATLEAVFHKEKWKPEVTLEMVLTQHLEEIAESHTMAAIDVQWRKLTPAQKKEKFK